MRALVLKPLHDALAKTAKLVDGKWKWFVTLDYVRESLTQCGLDWALGTFVNRGYVIIYSRHSFVDDGIADPEDAVFLNMEGEDPVRFELFDRRLASKWSERIVLETKVLQLRSEIERAYGGRYNDEIERKFNGLRKLIRKSHP